MLVSPTSVPKKGMEQITMETISKHVKDKKVIRSDQLRFMKVKSHLNSLIVFCMKRRLA